MKKTLIVNTARKICNRDAIAEALENGQLSGYAGGVRFPQPARTIMFGDLLIMG